jgi:hypothetical protein
VARLLLLRLARPALPWTRSDARAKRCVQARICSVPQRLSLGWTVSLPSAWIERVAVAVSVHSPRRQGRAHGGAFWAALVLACTLLAVVVAPHEASAASAPPPIPDVLGCSPDVARAAIQKAGFTMAPDGDVPGQLRAASQYPLDSPPASWSGIVKVNFVDPEARSIDTIGRLPPCGFTVVPDVRGASLEDATARLSQAGLGPPIVRGAGVVDDETPVGVATLPVTVVLVLASSTPTTAQASTAGRGTTTSAATSPTSTRARDTTTTVRAAVPPSGGGSPRWPLVLLGGGLVLAGAGALGAILRRSSRPRRHPVGAIQSVQVRAFPGEPQLRLRPPPHQERVVGLAVETGPTTVTTTVRPGGAE